MPVSGVKASRGRKPRRPPRTSTCLVVYASLGAMWPRGFHGCGAGRAGRRDRGDASTRAGPRGQNCDRRVTRDQIGLRTPAHGRDSSRRRGQRQPINVNVKRPRTERSLLSASQRSAVRAEHTPRTRSFARSPRQRRESSLQSTTTYMYISITRASTVVVSSSPRLPL